MTRFVSAQSLCRFPDAVHQDRAIVARMPFSQLACCLTLLYASFLNAATLSDELAASAPDADPRAIAQALQASTCAVLMLGVKQPERLALIDYSHPSVDRRLWIFDLQAKTLLLSDYVAHGRGSGENFARVFSNREGSLQSSLGLFVTAESYVGVHGRSLRLDGLEPEINDQARARAIVLHGADYVNPMLATMQGRIGRSHGCPAVRPEVTDQVIDALQGGQMLYAYYLDREQSAPFRGPHSRRERGGSIASASQHSLEESVLLRCKSPDTR